MNAIRQWWAGLNGAAKGFIEGTGAAVLTASGDAVIQEMTSGGLSFDALDWKQVAAAGVLAGVVYVRANLTGLLRYPDGSTIHADPVQPTPPAPAA